MILKDKVAVIYGAGGAIGGAAARAFAREGASVSLVGRTLASLEIVAKEIAEVGGVVDVAPLDASDKQAVEDHLSALVKKAGHLDISFNVIGLGDTQGFPLVEMAPSRFTLPIITAMNSHFVTATAAARHMAQQKSGVILAITANVVRMPVPNVGGFGVACAAIEALCRQLAVELGPQGIRVVCLRSAGSPDAPGVREAFKLRAKEQGITLEEFTVQAAIDIPLRRLPLLADIANTAALMASDHARAITAEVVNLTGGQLMD
jgi:NAD(P)-dependent dehydrogenase (short-subunit alcohol dehydrogenase family)